MNNLQERATAGIPGGQGRLHTFASELRATTVIRNGTDKVRLDGYASMTERHYEMWDIFGEYKEVISRDAFDETLAANPDVAFLVNHRGVTMARSTNGTLELRSDPLGLKSVAYVNPERQDVKDLVAAIKDGDITEMSFAFMIEDGGWNDDYTEYRINKVNIDRGDVSAVNYGANPYTSIAARCTEILSELDKMPAGAQRAAYQRLATAMSTTEQAATDRAAALSAERQPDEPEKTRQDPEEDTRVDPLEEERGAIPVRHTQVVDKPWDGGAAEKNLKDGDTSAYRACYAWVDSTGDKTTKTAYKFPHHEVGSDGSVGAANINGVRNALARLTSAHIPDGDRNGVKAHLNAHMNDFHGADGEKKAAPGGRDLRLIEALLDI